MPSESAIRGFDRTFWTRALGAVLLVSIAVGSTAAMAATPADASLVEGSQRLLIASVLVFAAIGFVGYRIAGDYVESLTHHDEVAIAEPANDDVPATPARRTAEPVRAVAPVVSPVVSPVRARTNEDRYARPIRVAPTIPEPQPVQGLFMRSSEPSRAEPRSRVEPRSAVTSRVEPRSAVVSPVAPRSTVAAPVAARSAPVTPVVSPVRGRQPTDRFAARTVAPTASPSRAEPTRSEAARSETRSVPSTRTVTTPVQGVRGRESAVRARA
ncbi:MAG: hypothetical protein HXX10_22525 [Rhodoplanes sp.]|uniref:hypothetical protein n=1 Tax=Rhodoplanes sp. TaxID=1968906 RepID=UPI0017B7F2B9|nr:hypothetical protein [Rhodoplanes sp.]NVO16810.1 hypothetical protein [Rhodoplanes sp.]